MTFTGRIRLLTARRCDAIFQVHPPFLPVILYSLIWIYTYQHYFLCAHFRNPNQKGLVTLKSDRKISFSIICYQSVYSIDMRGISGAMDFCGWCFGWEMLYLPPATLQVLPCKNHCGIAIEIQRSTVILPMQWISFIQRQTYWNL